jgi:hypothetical protein
VISEKDSRMIVERKIYPNLDEIPKIENKRSVHDNDNHMD